MQKMFNNVYGYALIALEKKSVLILPKFPSAIHRPTSQLQWIAKKSTRFKHTSANGSSASPKAQ